MTPPERPTPQCGFRMRFQAAGRCRRIPVLIQGNRLRSFLTVTMILFVGWLLFVSHASGQCIDYRHYLHWV